MTTPLLQMRIRSITQEADAIFSFELRALDGSALPGFTAGAHIALLLPGGIERSYSLVNAQGETHRYVVAVQRDPAGRGGSLALCDKARPGDLIQVRPPLNNFDLVEAAGESVFIAGGIGITPLWSMIQRLDAIGRRWRLHYAARRRSEAAFVSEIESLASGDPDCLGFAFRTGAEAPRLDIGAIVASLGPDAHVYCCGPVPMLESFAAATEALPPDRVHAEYFAATDGAAEGGFFVELAREGRTLFIPEDKTILDVLIEEGIGVSYSCRQGLCGVCETPVLAGTPDHRDVVLSARQKAAGKSMMICRSGCIGGKLVLDM
jgi:tetrachlorobenzoquinone reductase